MSLTDAQRELIGKALAAYGAKLDADFIVSSDGKKLAVWVEVKAGRLRFVCITGLLASAPITEKGVGDFVEKFWFWKRRAS